MSPLRLPPLLALALPALLHATPDTLFLTWDKDPARTMTIQWIAPGAELPLVSGAESTADPGAHVREIPRLDAIKADGDLADWPAQARRVTLFPVPDATGASAEDFSAELRLGWTPDALAVALTVRDDHFVPPTRRNSPLTGDSVELFVGPAEGAHIQIIAGLADESFSVSGPGARNIDSSKLKPARATDAQGRRVLEFLVPLAAVGGKPAAGETLRVQAIVNDFDPGRSRTRHAWFPSVETSADASAFHTVRLVDSRSAQAAHAEDLRAIAGTSELRLVAAGARAGEEIEARSGDRRLGSAMLAADKDGLARASIAIPAAERGRQWGRLRLGSAARAGERIAVDSHVAASTRAPDPVTIRYWAEGENESAARSASSTTRTFRQGTGVHVQRVRLEGLAPDTRYRFRVGDSASVESFLTAPAKLEAPLVFTEGGDIGTAPIVPTLHRMASSWSPRFAVVGGDLAYADGVHLDRWWHYLRDWHAHMRTPAGDLVPMLVCIGNHEVRGGYGARGAAPFFYALFEGLYPKTGYAALDFGDWLSFLFLDTAHSTPIPGPQAEWLKKALAERRHVLHRFAVWHVPAWPSTRDFNNRWSSEVREHWVPLIEADPPSLVFEHHDHTYKRTHPLREGKPHPEGVVYVGDGNWGVSPRPVYPERPYLAKALSAHNLLRVTIRPDGTGEVRVVNEKGAELDAFTFSRPKSR